MIALVDLKHYETKISVFLREPDGKRITLVIPIPF